MGTTPTCTTCSSESVASAKSTALRAASSASSEPSVASRIFVGKTTLTSTDQATLKNFLDGGGKLVITGMDALFLIEGSPFVSSTLNLDVASCVGGETFSGASCTAFDGEAYTFNSPTAYAPYHAMVVPATSAAVIQGSYPEVPPTWKSKDGTSMAAPH